MFFHSSKAKIRALAKSGASFKVSCHLQHGNDSTHSCAYTTIIPVCRVIPHVTESTMWFYAKREHDTGERTLGIIGSLAFFQTFGLIHQLNSLVN